MNHPVARHGRFWRTGVFAGSELGAGSFPQRRKHLGA